jgi:CHAT domain-containing protein
MPSPVIYLAFANDEINPLPDLTEESEHIDSSLQTNDHILETIQVRNDKAASAQSILQNLTNYSNRIVLFHFGGHADQELLQLTDQKILGEGVAQLLGQQKNLACVFLNGCNTRGFVKDILSAGVPIVIATSRKIGDDQAKTLATQFYDALADGKSIRQAFDQAKAVTQIKVVANRRDIDYRGIVIPEENDDDFPRGLYNNDDKDLAWSISDVPEDIDLVPNGSFEGAIALISALVLLVIWSLVHMGYLSTTFWIGVGSLFGLGIIGTLIKAYGKQVPKLQRLKALFLLFLLKKPVVIPLCGFVLFVWLFVTSVCITHPTQGPLKVDLFDLSGQRSHYLRISPNSTADTRILVLSNPVNCTKILVVEGYVPDTLTMTQIIGKTYPISLFQPRPVLLIRIRPEEFEMRPFTTISIRINDDPSFEIRLNEHNSALILGKPIEVPKHKIDEWNRYLIDHEANLSDSEREYCIALWNDPMPISLDKPLTLGDRYEILLKLKDIPYITVQGTLETLENNEEPHDVLLDEED